MGVLSIAQLCDFVSTGLSVRIVWGMIASAAGGRGDHCASCNIKPTHAGVTSIIRSVWCAALQVPPVYDMHTFVVATLCCVPVAACTFKQARAWPVSVLAAQWVGGWVGGSRGGGLLAWHLHQLGARSTEMATLQSRI